MQNTDVNLIFCVTTGGGKVCKTGIAAPKGRRLTSRSAKLKNNRPNQDLNSIHFHEISSLYW